MPGSRIDRRQLLAGLGVGGLGALAGCSDFDPLGVGDEEVSLSALRITDVGIDPSSARQTELVTATVTVANDGEGTFDGTVEVQHDGDPVEQRSVTVAGGDTESVSVAFEALRVGDVELETSLRRGSAVADTTTTTIAVEPTPDSFVGVDGTEFTLDDGTFYVSGAQPKIGYVYSISDPIPERLREAAFDGLERIGATVARLHAFTYAPIPLGEPFPGEDNEQFFERLDKAIVAAKRRGIRLSLNIVEGAPQYLTDPKRNPGLRVPTFVDRVDSADEINDFFEDEACIRLYEDWVDELLTHENHLTGVEYRNDPTVMMWELGNELERYPTEGRTSIRPWVEEVGTYVQDHLDDQLLTTGMNGWPGRNAFVEDHEPDCIDVCSLHWWVGPAHYDVSDEEALGMFEEKVEQAHDTLQKPLWVGEYNWGYPGAEDGRPVTDEFLEERNRNLRKWHDRMDDLGVAGAALHVLGSKEINEGVSENDHRTNGTTVYADADAGTVEELRRFAARMREKSTASDVPELPPMD